MPSVSILSEVQQHRIEISGGIVRPLAYASDGEGANNTTPQKNSLDHLAKNPDGYDYSLCPYATLPDGHPLYVPIEIQKASIHSGYDEEGYLHKREEINTIDPREEKTRDQWGWKPTKWDNLTYQLWIDRAFLRFFEIWKKGTEDDIIRGYQGTKQFKRSISGKIGGNYNGGFKESIKPLIRLESGEWALSNTRPLYPNIRRLPPEGIANARALARQLKQQRLAARQARFEHK